MIRFWIIIKILYILSLVFGIHTSFAQEPGISEKEILIGTTTPLSGPFAGIGTQISKIGAQTYFRHINDTGGINGRKIINKISDDSFKPEKAVEYTKALIKRDKVFCLFANFGTHTTLAITSLLKGYKIPLFSPISLSRRLVIPLDRYLFLLYPNFFTQAQKIISYTKSMDRKRVAIMYVDNYLGMEGVLGTKKAMKGSELKLVDEIRINPNVA